MDLPSPRPQRAQFGIGFCQNRDFILVEQNGTSPAVDSVLHGVADSLEYAEPSSTETSIGFASMRSELSPQDAICILERAGDVSLLGNVEPRELAAKVGAPVLQHTLGIRLYGVI